MQDKRTPPRTVARYFLSRPCLSPGSAYTTTGREAAAGEVRQRLEHPHACGAVRGPAGGDGCHKRVQDKHAPVQGVVVHPDCVLSVRAKNNERQAWWSTIHDPCIRSIFS